MSDRVIGQSVFDAVSYPGDMSAGICVCTGTHNTLWLDCSNCHKGTCYHSTPPLSCWAGDIKNHYICISICSQASPTLWTVCVCM